MNERIATLRKFIDEDPGDTFSKYALALELVKSEGISEALHVFSEIVDSVPDYLPVYYHFGKLLEQVGETARAADIYRHGIAVATRQKQSRTLSELKSALEQMD
jgi:predicted RNA polymerase sigma factor